MKFSKRTCSVCETPGSKLFRIPSNENVEDIQSTSSDTLSALPSAAFQCTNVEVCEAKPLCSKSMDAEPSFSESIMDSEPSFSESIMDAEPSCSESMDAEPSISESIMDAEPSISESIMDAEPSCSESFVSSPTSSHNTSAHLAPVQVLSHSVVAALNLYVKATYIDSKASETSEFVYKMDKIFDSVNYRSLKHQKKEMCAVTENSGHVELWKKTIPWIEKWHIRSSKTGRKIYAACKNGWLITLNAFIGISEILLKKIKFILTSRFSQDALENTFSTLRRRGGFRDNPDAYECRPTIQKVITSNFLKQSRGKNCQDDEAYSLIDFTCFNKKELLDIISSEDCAAANVQRDVDILNLNTLDSVEENVLSYVSGYFVKNICY
ncbi:hypothetical protein AVEN_83713-1 [Araneus ventricosus]|uniref:Transposable element P transposase n=1 Tax=Araneus ventricosus TaxID=182803 RepID=A0A4Y2SFX3_ARAVE|nr:hypothetical protein AVEN_83713-1 [Araneus ventricosus]